MPIDYEGGTLTGDVYAYVNGKYVRVEGLQGVTLTQVDEQLGKLDYVRVVRCEDCKWWDPATLSSGNCNRAFDITAYRNDYCSYGERRTDA